MNTHAGLLFLGHAKFHVARELAHDGRLTAEQVLAGQELVTRDLIDQAAMQANSTGALADLDARSAGFTIAELWAAIVAFFESPAGQLILKALVTMILALLGL